MFVMVTHTGMICAALKILSSGFVLSAFAFLFDKFSCNMTVVDFSILFDQGNVAYLPGQMLIGKVRIILDAPKILRKVKIKFHGRAHVQWSERERRGGSRKSVTYSASEHHFKRKLVLDEREENFILQAGEHWYPFSVLIPKNIPSSFKDSHGDVSYYATAKLKIPGQINKTRMEYFKVKNHLNLNDFPELKVSSEVQRSKKFYHLCCISAGTLTIRVSIPKSGYTANESIPLILEINNQSHIALNKITAYLIRKMEWRAHMKTKTSVKKLNSFSLSSASRHTVMTASENVPIPNYNFPYLENCRIITVKHFLHIEADPAGAHCDLDLVIPITLGDIPFNDGDESNHFLPSPDYDEAGILNAAFVNYEELKAKGVILTPSSLTNESKFLGIFENYSREPNEPEPK